MTRIGRRWLSLLLVTTAIPAMAETIDLVGLSLEELMDIPVNLVSRKDERLGEAPAAVSVITAQELHRSGVQTIAEALRLVPGMQVARIDASKWAISSRGFNSRFTNKLLVQIDGRSVYSPFFSGVFWEDQDLVLADIARIEVTRGPGATLWGANAVDGVINVVTKNAVDTQGTYVRMGGGKEERASASFRYGARAAESLHYRVYGKVFDRDSFRDLSDESAHDGWHQGRGGFRADWYRAHDRVMVQGGLYGGRIDFRQQTIQRNAPYQVAADEEIESSGGHLLGNWRRRYSDRSEMELQVYFDWTRRLETIEEERHTFDVDFQHRWQIASAWELIWGGEARTTADEISKTTFANRLDPLERRSNIFSAFAQTHFDLVPDKVNLMAGSKFEHNSFTGLEIQPSVRLRWMPWAQQTFWAAVSRAVRIPSRTDADARYIVGVIAPGVGFLGLPPPAEGTPATFLTLAGNENLDVEKVRALEAGYRGGLGDRWLVDIAVFRNTYEDLTDVEIGGVTSTADPDPYLSLALNTTNGLSGSTWGVEATVEGSLTNWWRLRAGYTRLELDLTNDLGALVDQLRLDATTPAHQFSLHSSMDWRTTWELDGGLRYVDDLSALGVDSHVIADMRLARSLGSRYEVALIGRNLLEGKHLEFVPRFITGDPVQIERSLFATLTGRW